MAPLIDSNSGSELVVHKVPQVSSAHAVANGDSSQVDAGATNTALVAVAAAVVATSNPILSSTNKVASAENKSANMNSIGESFYTLSVHLMLTFSTSSVTVKASSTMLIKSHRAHSRSITFDFVTVMFTGSGDATAQQLQSVSATATATGSATGGVSIGVAAGVGHINAFFGCSSS